MQAYVEYFQTHGQEYLYMIWQHLYLSLLAVAIAAAIGIPCGILCLRVPKVKKILTTGFSALRIIPSLAVLVILIPIMGVGVKPALTALVILAIPPILIQTFIENAIKHSNTFDEPIIIRTDIAWMTAGGNSHENIQIQVMDTGCGFSEDILQSLNSAIPLEPQNGHRIGITNAIQRLNLLYGQGEAVITFSNLPSGGACVTILLPAV